MNVSSNKMIYSLFSSSLDKITSETFKISKDEKTFIENHEMIEDFYELIKVYLKLCDNKQIFDDNMNCIKWIFEMGINGLLMENVNAHIVVTSFYQQFFEIVDANNKSY